MKAKQVLTHMKEKLNKKSFNRNVKSQIRGENMAIKGYTKSAKRFPHRAGLFKHIRGEEIGHARELKDALLK